MTDTPDISAPPDDKRLFGAGEVLTMAWPAALTMLNSTLMRFVDGLMVSRVGPAPFGAQLVGGITSFVPEAFAMGMLTVVTTYVSQNLGAGRMRRCGQYGWAGMTLAVAFGLLVVPLAVFAPLLFGAIGHAEHVRVLEVMYFRYMIASIMPSLIARVVQQFLFGIHRPRVVMVTSLAANLFNLGANYVLIFGKLGFPAMGLEGAAIGTLASWCVLCAIMLAIYLSREMHEQFATRAIRAFRVRQVGALLRVGLAPGVQLCNDVLTWSVFLSLLVGRFGELHLYASSAAMRWMPLSFMPAVGIGVAATALVGRYIGAGRPDLARRRAHVALVLAIVYMGGCALAFFVFRRQMVDLFMYAQSPGAVYTTPAEVERVVTIGGYVMICAAVFQLFDALGIVYIGALRGAGDTLWPMVGTIALSWGVTVGGGYAIVMLAPQLGSVGPWLAASGYVILLGLAMAWRFESGAWRKIDLLGRARRADANLN